MMKIRVYRKWLINIFVFFLFKLNLFDIFKSMSFEDGEKVKDLFDVGSK